MKKEGCDNPIEMLAPLVKNINSSQYAKLLGHIKSCERYELNFCNKSGGYNNGCMSSVFYFKTTKAKKYFFTFSSNLKGDYRIGKEDKNQNPEFWSPYIDIIVSENVGSVLWIGNKKELMKYTDELNKTLSNKKEINQIKQKIGDMQRELAKLQSQAS